MHLVTRIVIMSRAARLAREFREIQKIARALPAGIREKLALITLRELAQAGRTEFPHLYGTPADRRYKMWGTGTDTGLARARSDNPQVRLRGIALWLAVAFHETRNSNHPQIDAVHRRILGMLRELKETLPKPAASPAWDRARSVA